MIVIGNRIKGANNAIFLLYANNHYAFYDLSSIGGTKKMMNYIIPLLGSYFDGGLYTYTLIPIFCLAFIATVPCIIRSFFEMR